MPKMIDLRDLPEEEAKFVENLVDFLKDRAKVKKGKQKEQDNFSTWPLGVKGNLTRKEIYDYL